MRARLLWAAAWIIPAIALGSLDVFFIGFLGCHGGGGFCATEPDVSTTRWLYGSGAAVAVSGGMVAVGLARRWYAAPVGLLIAGLAAWSMVAPRLP